jgi:GT2 family glycosyltransferase
MNSFSEKNINIFKESLKKYKFLDLKIKYKIIIFTVLSFTTELIWIFKDILNKKLNDQIKEILKKIYRKSFISLLFRKYLHGRSREKDLFEQNFPTCLPHITTNDKIKLINKLHYSLNNKIEVTIIIAAYNNLDTTLNCLLSVLVFETKLKYEIILVDDCSLMVDYRTFGFKFRVIRNDRNIGFIKSNNLASKNASGKFLFFLNNDTIIKKSTINELHKSYFFNEKVGAVGSRSISKSYLIQEAGAFTFKSGTCWNYGRGDDPNKSIYNFTREVDYCSAYSLFIKKKLFYKLGFFDTRYCPAYYEDVDLAFKIRQKKLKVLYEPKSFLYHYEGSTSGRDIKSGVKKYQVINQIKFKKKWSRELKKYHSSINQQLKMRENIHVLIIDDLIPDHQNDAGSFYVYNFLQILLYFKIKLTILGSKDGGLTKNFFNNKDFLERQSIEVFVNNSADNMGQFINSRINSFDYIIISRPNNFNYFYKYIKNKKKIIYSMIDYHQKRLLSELIFKNKDKNNDYFLAKHLEDQALKKSYKVLCFGKQDQINLIKNEKNIKKKIILFPLVNKIIKNNNNFKLSDKRNLLFIANFSHEPNLTSLNNFIENFFIKLCKINKKIKLNVIGSIENKKMINHKQIIYKGHVNDLSIIFNETLFSVVPIEYGAGISGKLLYSMANGAPCLVSKFVEKQMNLTSGVNCLTIDYNKDITYFNQFFFDKKLIKKLSNNSIKFIKDNYSLNANIKNIREINKILFKRKNSKKNIKNIKLKYLI